MIVTMEVRLDEAEVLELVKAEVVRKLGPAPKGYHLEARRYYDEVKVVTQKDPGPEEPAAANEVVEAAVELQTAERTV